jgi:hypothetical protein
MAGAEREGENCENQKVNGGWGRKVRRGRRRTWVKEGRGERGTNIGF